MFYERPNLLFLTCRLSLDFMLNEQKMPAFRFCIIVEIIERGKWFRCSQPWLFGIFESQKNCLLNIRVGSKFSYFEYSVLLLEMCINWSEPFCLWAIIQHEVQNFLPHSSGNRFSWQQHLCCELYEAFSKYLWQIWKSPEAWILSFPTESRD